MRGPYRRGKEHTRAGRSRPSSAPCPWPLWCCPCWPLSPSVLWSA